ncbi:alpha/beta-hydrolase [Polyplosphaeria fusca]|uniref:Alpha/beta-hydrolase n=1 Tax=Polyplosphaeria fusca TaxID=682080 RepID=A0A9P4R8R4_9PLEO|nr:alpha/beta-hydrolase [Polyplosphaeria fusca]
MPSPRSPLLVLAGAAALGSFVFCSSLRRSTSLPSSDSKAIPSPQRTLLPRLNDVDIEKLPYPPDALPGGRDVTSPCGTIRVYEWGPEDGKKVLLIHGISTPCIALAGVAYRLVDRGCRVMLFDLFSRGYSSGPSPSTHNYDSCLYNAQILFVLHSSPLGWTSAPITLVGYSLGGALAADFTFYFPSLVHELILVASGGLIRAKHISWKSSILYSTAGLLPDWVQESLVARRLWTGPQSARSIEPDPKDVPEEKGSERRGGLNSQAVYRSSEMGLLDGNENSTVGKVVDWQILHHEGFVKAFISSIQHAPIHGQQHCWGVIGERLKQGSWPLIKVHLIVGRNDPIIIPEEVEEDAKSILGEEFVTVEIVEGSGHEIPIERPDVIATAVCNALVKRTS